MNEQKRIFFITLISQGAAPPLPATYFAATLGNIIETFVHFGDEQQKQQQQRRQEQEQAHQDNSIIILPFWIQCEFVYGSRFNSTNPHILFTRSSVLPPRIFWLAGSVFLPPRWDVSHQEQWARQALTNRPEWYPTPPIPCLPANNHTNPSFLTMMSGYDWLTACLPNWTLKLFINGMNFFPNSAIPRLRYPDADDVDDEGLSTTTSSFFSSPPLENKFVLCIDHVSYLILLGSSAERWRTVPADEEQTHSTYRTLLPSIHSKRTGGGWWWVILFVKLAFIQSLSQFSCRLTLLACGRVSLLPNFTRRTKFAKYSQNS